MKNIIFLSFILLIGGLTNSYGAVTCENEKGYNDFPFTQEGLTVTASGTGGYQVYEPSYTSCGVTTKPNSVYIGQTPSTFTNTFSTPVNDMVYNFNAANLGEVVTITTSSGTPTVTYENGDCSSGLSISGNTITFGSGSTGGRIKIHSTSTFNSVTFSHNGAAAGLLMTMCFDAAIESLGPTVTTTAISSITNSSASSGGEVTSDGGAAVTVRGVSWNTTGSPTTSDNTTSDGSGLGTYSSSMTGLAPGTTYYVRAYATNTSGTGYGNEVSFSTTADIATYTVGGTVSGLTGSVTLQNNVGDDIIKTTNDGFTFTAQAEGTDYAVTVSSQPTGQTCSVGNGSGTNITANITNVAVDCVDDVVAPPPVPMVPIPAMSEWALILLTMLLGLMVFANRKRLF